MWVRFIADHDYSPAAKRGRVTIAYKAGQVCNVTRACARHAIDAGRAEETTAPRKDSNHGQARRRTAH